MRGLHGLAWRGLRARPLRTALTTIGVALGVAVLYAGLATNAGIDAAVDRAVEHARRAGRPARRGLRRGRAVRGDAGDRSRDTPGVAVAAPSFERRTYLGTGLFGPGPLPAPVTLVGIDPALEPRIHDLTLAAGSPLEPGDDPSALVSATLAREDGLTVGSTCRAARHRRPRLSPGRRHPGRRRPVGRSDGPCRRHPSAGRAVRVRC